jgi:hypothetical protein
MSDCMSTACPPPSPGTPLYQHAIADHGTPNPSRRAAGRGTA